ncbi:hypothetical protein Tco_0816980 [Tanacetum coccineum]
MERRSRQKSHIALATSKLQELSKTTSRVARQGELNKLTVKNRYPLPRIDYLFDQLRGVCPFLKIDFRPGFHQLRVHEDAIPKNAFRTRYGYFESTVMPFGLTRFAHRRKEESMKVLLKFGGVGVTMKGEGCIANFSSRFWLQMCIFLGPSVVNQSGIHMDPSKIEVVKNWKAPTTPSEKKQKYEWGEKEEEAFLPEYNLCGCSYYAAKSVRDPIGFEYCLASQADIRESSLTGLELVQGTTDKVVLVKEKGPKRVWSVSNITRGGQENTSQKSNTRMEQSDHEAKKSKTKPGEIHCICRSQCQLQIQQSTFHKDRTTTHIGLESLGIGWLLRLQGF